MNEKRKKLLLITACIGIFAAGIFIGKFAAWLSGPDKRVIYEAQLNGALKTAKKYGIEAVYLKDLTGFEWERVCTIYHYISNEEIEERIGVKSYDFTDYEGQTGLLFIDKNQKLIQIKIFNIGLMDAIDKIVDKKHAFKDAVYCAEKANAKIVFYKYDESGIRAAALVQQ